MAALVLGVAGLILFVMTGFGLAFFLNLPCSILAWALGVSGRRRVDRGETAQHRGLALAGMITGILGVGIGVLGLAGWVLIIVLAGNWSWAP